ncbi:TPA: type I restriction enzyme endonuclease domain-containing protein [Vibrio vulnificus]
MSAFMRNLVRRLLRRWNNPPDASEEAIKLVLEQAKVLADGYHAA